MFTTSSVDFTVELHTDGLVCTFTGDTAWPGTHRRVRIAVMVSATTVKTAAEVAAVGGGIVPARNVSEGVVG